MPSIRVVGSSKPVRARRYAEPGFASLGVIMSDRSPAEPRRSLVLELATGIRRSGGHLAAATALTAAAIVATFGAFSRGAASPEPPLAPPAAPAHAEAATDASVLSMLGLPPSFDAQARDLQAVADWMDVAALPSPTATPIPPTPVPPTPRPAAPSAPAIPTATPRLQQPAPPPPPPPPPPPAPTATPVSAQPSGPWGLDASPMDGMSQALFNATNARRAASGLAPLRVNGWLVGVARIRSADMAQHNYFAHTSPVTGDTAFSLMDTHAVPYAWAGENLAKNNYPAGEAVAVADDALWNSPPHRENILNPNYTDMGIALVTDGTGMHYFTIVFTGP